eukprot:15349046-Ditylum_brightwellii.AAC.1
MGKVDTKVSSSKNTVDADSLEKIKDFLKVTKVDDSSVNEELWNQRCQKGIFNYHMEINSLKPVAELSWSGQ